MKNKNLFFFYLHETLFQLAGVMMSLVLPVFIYQTFGSVAAVFGFFLTWNVIYSIFMIPVLNLAIISGRPKYFMVLGMLFFALGMGLIGRAESGNIALFYWGALFFTLYISFYWIIRHWFFAVNVESGNIGRQTSFMGIIVTLVNFLGPIMGGFLAFKYSFNAVFILVFVLILLSTLPLFLFHFPVNIKPLSIRKIKTILNKKEIKLMKSVYFWEGVEHTAMSDTWILIFTIFIGSIFQLGILTAFATLVTILITWLVGGFFDKKRRVFLLDKFTKIKALSVLLYLSLIVFPSPIYVWLVEFLNKIIFKGRQTVTESYFYSMSNKIDPLEFNITREIYLNIGRILFSSLFIIIFSFVDEWFLWVILAIGALSGLGLLGLKKGDYLLNK